METINNDDKSEVLLITGITGHSGAFFLRQLIRHNYPGIIRCIVRPSSDTILLDSCGLQIEKCFGDIRDKKFLSECMVGVKTVFHIVSIRHTLDIIEVARKHNVTRMISVHTTGVFSSYKAAAAEYKEIESRLAGMIANSTLKLTILRPTMIYGDLSDHNMSKFIKLVDRLRIFPLVNQGESLIQPVNARDLGKAYFQILTMPIERIKAEYILSGEKPIQLIDALKTISDCLHKKTVFISFPIGVGIFLARTLKFLSLGKVDYIEKVQRMGEDRSFCHKDAQLDFGYSPMAFNKGIEQEVNEYMKVKGK